MQETETLVERLTKYNEDWKARAANLRDYARRLEAKAEGLLEEAKEYRTQAAHVQRWLSFHNSNIIQQEPVRAPTPPAADAELEAEMQFYKDKGLKSDDVISVLHRRTILKEWQPIETAPKIEHEDILVYRPNATRSPKVGVDYWSSRYTAKPCWARSRPAEQPTHWMPLPAPPEPSLSKDSK